MEPFLDRGRLDWNISQNYFTSLYFDRIMLRGRKTGQLYEDQSTNVVNEEKRKG